MEIAQAVIGNIVGLIAFALIVAVAMKTFQIGNALTEIKDQLSSMKRDMNPSFPSGAPIDAQKAISGEEMLRAVSAELEREAALSIPAPPAIPEPSDVLHEVEKN